MGFFSLFFMWVSARMFRGNREEQFENNQPGDQPTPVVPPEVIPPDDETYDENYLVRLTDPNYADGIGELDSTAPNARGISNAVAQQTGDTPSLEGASNLLWAWGQFIDHDISLTPATGGEFAPIIAPVGDPEFAPGTLIPFTRVVPVEGSGITTPRVYENEITSLMDGSMVYGSTPEVTEGLRDGAYLRLDDQDQVILTDNGVLVGDVRGAENVALTSMHTLFAREHNTWVDRLAEENPNLDEDALFDMARIRVETEIQAITYNEWLPLIVGGDAISDYDAFDPNASSAISVEFSTTAFRFGHSLLPSQLERVNEDGSDIEQGDLALRDAFFNPAAIAEGGGIDPLLRGLAGSDSQALDTQVVEDVRSFLLGEDVTTGLDLAALNIERGRDLGLELYNDMREGLGFERAEDFSDITDDPALIARLESVYEDVDQVDAWVGGLAEDPVEGGMVGETFAAVIVQQFEAIRDADPYWSEGGADLTDEEFDDLWSTRLSDVVQDNTEIEVLQDDAFFTYDRIGGDEDDNEVIGDEDRDLLIGFGGDDTLNGGDGDDHLYGGLGNDVLFGGEGADNFAIGQSSGGDLIQDFQTGQDRISIDVEDTEVSISDLFMPIEAGVRVDFGGGHFVDVLGVDEDDLENAIELF